MSIEAKRAAKLEKKLKTLLGGYQVRFLEILRHLFVFFLSSIRLEVKR